MKKTVDKRVYICYNHHVAKNKRVCWNWQTGTFEGRVSLAYGFKSRHSHQPMKPYKRLFKLFVGFYFFAQIGLFFTLFFICLF